MCRNCFRRKFQETWQNWRTIGKAFAPLRSCFLRRASAGRCFCVSADRAKAYYLQRECHACSICGMRRIVHERTILGARRVTFVTGKLIRNAVTTPRETFGSCNSSCAREKIQDVADFHTVVDKQEYIVAVADFRLLSLIWGCCRERNLFKGLKIHSELQKRGLVVKSYSDALITLYAKCDEVQLAQRLLDMHGSARIVPWTTLIEGYVRQRQCHKAIKCFTEMQQKGIWPDAVVYTSMLKGCAVLKDLECGKRFHYEISRQGLLEHDCVLGGALVDMYIKCGALSQAHCVLGNISSGNAILWSALIAGYAENGQGEKALGCYEQMKSKGIPPNAVTFSCILKACAVAGALDKGKVIHKEILRQGLFERDTVLDGGLVDMYAKCGDLPQAQSVLEKIPAANSILWSNLIAGYARKGLGQESLECYAKMRDKGFHADAVTYVCALKACGMIGALDKGRQIHERISSEALSDHNIVLNGALVDMYTKCGAFLLAHKVLENLPFRNVVLWSAMIVGYSKRGQFCQALECFNQMEVDGIIPDAVIYLYTLKACAMIGATHEGKQIHDKILRQGLLDNDLVLGNVLVDMYAKWSELWEARSAVSVLPCRDIFSWNALIPGFTKDGQCDQAFESIGEIQKEDIFPDAVSDLLPA